MSDTLNLQTLNVQTLHYKTQSDNTGDTYSEMTINNTIKLDENKKLWLLDSTNADDHKYFINNGGNLRFGTNDALVDIANTDDLTNLQSETITVASNTIFKGVPYTWPDTAVNGLLQCTVNGNDGILSWGPLDSIVLGSVELTNATTNHILKYNSSSKWVNSASIDNVTIGASTAAPGTFTTLAATSISSSTASITGSTTIGSPMILTNDTITSLSTNSGIHRTAITANPVTYINLVSRDEDIYYANLAPASIEGTVKHIFVKLDTADSTTIDLTFSTIPGNGSSGELVSGTGNATKLIFSSDGQSASLIYIGSAWRITNTGAAVE